jgi:hypothetical protein
MVGDVALQAPRHESCWFPFKKLYENRIRVENGGRSWNHDYDSILLRRMDSTAISCSQQKNTTTILKAGGIGPGSVDASSLSYGEGYSWEGGSRAVSTKSNQAKNDNNLAVDNDNSYHMQNNTKNNLPSNNSVIRNADFLDDKDSIVSMNPDGTYQYMENHRQHQELGVDLLPGKLAMVETNCMTKTFWTDEMVYGGAFACLQNKRCGGRKDREPRPQIEVVHIAPPSPPQEQQRTVTFKEDFRIVEEMTDYQSQLRKKQKSERIPRTLQAFGESEGIQYVSQDPEDINSGPPLRRALCTNVHLKQQQNNKTKQQQEQPKEKSQISLLSSSAPSSQPTWGHQETSMSSRSVESAFLNSASRGSSNGDMGDLLQPPNPISSWYQAQGKLLLSNNGRLAPKDFNVGCWGLFPAPTIDDKYKFQPQDDDRTPNVYEEVEAIQEQLNGVHDLEDSNAEDDEMYDNAIDIARKASLVDEDSSFMKMDAESVISTEKTQGVYTAGKKSKGGKLKVLRFFKSKNTTKKSTVFEDVQEEENGESEVRKGEVIMVQQRMLKCDGSKLRSDESRRESHPQAFNNMDQSSILDRVAERIRILELQNDFKGQDANVKGSGRFQDFDAEMQDFQRRKIYGRDITTSESSSTPFQVIDSSIQIDRQVFGGFPQTSYEDEEEDCCVSHRPKVASRLGHLSTNSEEEKKEDYTGRQRVQQINRPTAPAYDAYDDAAGVNSPVPVSPSSFQGVVASPIPKFDDNFWKEFDDIFWKDNDETDNDVDTTDFEEVDSSDDSLFKDLKSTTESICSTESDPSRVSYGDGNNNKNYNSYIMRGQRKVIPAENNTTRRSPAEKFQYTDQSRRPGTFGRQMMAQNIDTCNPCIVNCQHMNNLYTLNVRYENNRWYAYLEDGEMIRCIDKWLDF